MTTLQISITLVLSAFGIGLFVVLGFGIRRIEAAIESVETAVHDRANHLVLDLMNVANDFKADKEKAENKLLQESATIRAHAANAFTRLAEHVEAGFVSTAKHVTVETSKIKDEVVTHAKGALAAVANGVRHAFCATCNRLSHTWHVIEGKVECKDCEIRRTTN